MLSAPASAAWVFPDKTLDVTADKTNLTNRWNAILTEAKTYVTFSLNGSGSLPKVTLPLPQNKTVEIDLSQFDSRLSVIGVVVFFIGVLLAFYIILS